MKSGLVRNLEQIQESDGRTHRPRWGTWLLASLGVALVSFAAVSQRRATPARAAAKPDPLGELVARAGPTPSSTVEIGGKDVTFPGILSDDPRTTTALAVLRSPSHPAPTAAESAGSARLPSAPPPATDRLNVIPLPAKNIVSPSPLVSRPRDALTQLAKDAAPAASTPAEEGRPGGYQLQASSFRTDAEAAAFASALRQRGHKAYVEPAQLPGRGTWYRVRIGPFKTQREAAAYRADFERREHLVPFLVEPPKEPKEKVGRR